MRSTRPQRSGWLEWRGAGTVGPTSAHGSCSRRRSSRFARVWSRLQPVFYPSVAGHSTAAGGDPGHRRAQPGRARPGRFLEYLWELFLPKLAS